LQRSIAKLTKAQVTDIFSYSRRINTFLFSTNITEKKEKDISTILKPKKNTLFYLSFYLLFQNRYSKDRRPSPKVSLKKKKKGILDISLNQRNLLLYLLFQNGI
jgi:hypothetical protein